MFESHYKIPEILGETAVPQSREFMRWVRVILLRYKAKKFSKSKWVKSKDLGASFKEFPLAKDRTIQAPKIKNKIK